MPAILGRTFIQTGLFIVAHDAIHKSVIPSNRRLNHWIGRLAVTLYAFLPYQKLSLKHWQHHRNPGQISDPDFHDGIRCNAFAWYLRFMQGYLGGRQKIVLLLGMGTVFHTLQLGFHISVTKLILFWVLPIVLSSMQLFFFGTYLPHRSSVDSTKSGTTGNSHQATSSNYPLVWSFLTCYHFGYHWEHHEYPSLPWYRLPTVRQPQLQKQPIKTDIGNPLVLRLATTSPLFTLLLIAC
ncbi:MAG TPA: fatty acid desaturase [Coleofasciculaceae cyanobacterium]